MRYRLRAAARNEDWAVRWPPVHDQWFEATDDKQAIEIGRNYQIPFWDHPTDIAWIDRQDGRTIWILTVDEDRSDDRRPS